MVTGAFLLEFHLPLECSCCEWVWSRGTGWVFIWAGLVELVESVCSDGVGLVCLGLAWFALVLTRGD